MLIGNKIDMDADRKISKDQGEALAKHYNIKFFETSAKNSINIFEAFETITREIYNKSIVENAPKGNNAKSVFLFLRVVEEGKVVLSKETLKKQK